MITYSNMKKLNNYITESWSGVKKQSNIENIKSWCDKMDIENYTINTKGEIDVDGGVMLINKHLKELPYKFGKVKGSFTISANKELTSLKNCPDEVGGYFSCYECSKLFSLEGCPKKVGKYFNCNGCEREFTKEEVKSLCKVNSIYL